MTTADELKAALKTITPTVRRLWASGDREISAKGLDIVAEAAALNLERARERQAA